jgi:hypothetical protein
MASDDQRAVTVDYPFTEDEARAANNEWHCNCGPAALAFALQIGLDKVRAALAPTGFEQRRYTSPTMMHEALMNLGHGDFEAVRSPAKYAGAFNGKIAHARMFHGPMSLVRIQWTGPWTADGKTQKWAARQTHWICCWADSRRLVFDINGGMRTFDSWEREIVPLIVKEIPRADGGWYPANVWRLK